MKVLFTTDGSDGARYAIREGLRLLGNQPIEAVVVGVVDITPVTYGFDGLGPTTMVLVKDDLEASTLAALAEAAEVLAEAGHPVETLERRGTPGQAILEVASEIQPDLIVLGTHGRGAVGRLIAGSVSTHVVHHWAGATMVIRPRP